MARTPDLLMPSSASGEITWRSWAARIELPPAQLSLLVEPELRETLVAAFLDLGFTAVSLDLEGLVSGKLNRDLPQR